MKTMTHAEFNAMLSRLARDAMEDESHMWRGRLERSETIPIKYAYIVGVGEAIDTLSQWGFEFFRKEELCDGREETKD